MAKIDLDQHPPYIYSDYKSSAFRGPKQDPIDFSCLTALSPSEVVAEFA